MVHDLRMKQVSMPVIPSRERIEERLAEVRALARKLEILLVTAAEMDGIDSGVTSSAESQSALLDEPRRNVAAARDADRVGGDQ